MAGATKALPEERTRKRRSFNPRYPAWLTSPSLIYYAIFFLGPLAILVAFSLATQTGFNSISYGFDTSQYGLVTDSLWLRIFERTLVMAATGSILTIIVGYPIAYWMARHLSTYKMLALVLVLVPFWTSFLIRTYALKIILDSHGYLAKYLGINIMYTKYAVAVGLVYNYLPLFIIPVFASLERMDWSLIEAAGDLGRTRSARSARSRSASRCRESSPARCSSSSRCAGSTSSPTSSAAVSTSSSATSSATSSTLPRTSRSGRRCPSAS